MADISFLVFEDEKGHYILEGDGPIKDRTRIDLTPEQADAWIEAHKSEVESNEDKDK